MADIRVKKVAIAGPFEELKSAISLNSRDCEETRKGGDSRLMAFRVKRLRDGERTQSGFPALEVTGLVPDLEFLRKSVPVRQMTWFASVAGARYDPICIDLL